MDNMSINDVVFVAFLEIFINMLIALSLYANVKKYIKENFIQFITKAIIMVLFISISIYFERKYLTNIAAIATLSIIAFILGFKWIWKLNYRFSIIAGFTSIFCIMAAEFITYPFYPIILDFLQSNSFWQNRFILTLPSRLVQIFILFMILRKEYTLSDVTVLADDWTRMSKFDRITAKTLIITIGICMFFIFNFQDLFMKLNAYQIKSPGININLAVYFVQNFFYISVALFLIRRTRKYSKYKKILSQEPIDIFEKIVGAATAEELEIYAQRIEEKKKEVNINVI